MTDRGWRFLVDSRALSARVSVLLFVLAFMALLTAGLLTYAFTSM